MSNKLYNDFFKNYKKINNTLCNFKILKNKYNNSFYVYYHVLYEHRADKNQCIKTFSIKMNKEKVIKFLKAIKKSNIIKFKKIVTWIDYD